MIFIRKLPLPSGERAGVRGPKRNILKSQEIITPTLPSPIKGEEKNGDFWMDSK